MDEMYNGGEDVSTNSNDVEIDDTTCHTDNPTDDGAVIIEEFPETGSNETTPHIEIEEDPLAAPMKQFEELQQRAEDVEREESGDVEDAKNGRKLCATRHGCQGATDCNYAYGDYPG